MNAHDLRLANKDKDERGPGERPLRPKILTTDFAPQTLCSNWIRHLSPALRRRRCNGGIFIVTKYC